MASLLSVVSALFGRKKTSSGATKPAGRPPTSPALVLLAVAAVLAIATHVPSGGDGTSAPTPEPAPTTPHILSADLAVQAVIEREATQPAEAPSSSSAPAPASTSAAVPHPAAPGVAHRAGHARTAPARPRTTTPQDLQLARAREWRDPGESPMRMALVVLGLGAALALLVGWLVHRSRRAG